MSVITSTCEEIRDQPTNNSPAKHLFSFPKAQRFTERAPEPSKFTHNIRSNPLKTRHYPCLT